MAQELTTEEFEKHVKDWCYGNLTLVNAIGVPLNKGVSDGREFVLVVKFEDINGYPIVLGYYQDSQGKLYHRHFYRSNSESFWRVGTGFRCDAKDNAWVKGAEGHKEAMSGGYIFEGQVDYRLDAVLQAMPQTIQPKSGTKAVFDSKRNKVVLVPENYFSLIEAVKKDKNLCAYMVSPSESQCSKVVNDYVLHRKKKTVIPDSLWGGGPTRDVRVLQKSQVRFQQSAQDKKKPDPTLNNIPDLAADIKKDTALWDFINGCLKHHVGSYGFEHSALNEPCTVDIYKLPVNGGNVLVEIAHSKKEAREFVTKSGIKCSIDSPVCWVKSVYCEGGMSRYGNYSAYPEDLCFLVQKPMDYIVQTSTEVQRRMGKDEIASNVHGNYLLLALYNEKYSPLIQAFKAMKGFPLFKESSQKFIMAKGAGASITNFLKDCQTNKFEAIKENVRSACGVFQGNGGSSMSEKEKTGIEEFLKSDIKDYASLNFAMYKLFASSSKESLFIGAFSESVLAKSYSDLGVIIKDCKGDRNSKNYEQTFKKIYETKEKGPFCALERLALAAAMTGLIEKKAGEFTEQDRQVHPFQGVGAGAFWKDLQEAPGTRKRLIPKLGTALRGFWPSNPCRNG
ncbi:hypothetical protein [Archangium sp.]|uniref:hypothetical protein n=1 Tax=Archangium sp. TaxID=1872627 RepID=UPI002ED8452E